MSLSSVKNTLYQKQYEQRNRRENTVLYTHLDDTPIHEDWIYLESRNGHTFAGNILRIAQELNTGKYGTFRMFAYARSENRDAIAALLNNYHLTSVEIVTGETDAIALMERCKYLVLDSSLEYKFVKRQGQIILNTWHGTPLKHMGRSVTYERHIIGFSQHFFLSSDYILAPSQFFADTILNDYMVKDILPGKILFEGYPRNTIFLNSEKAQELKRVLGFEGKKLAVYMPTWRGEMNDDSYSKTEEEFRHILSDLDLLLSDDQIVLFKPHPFLSNAIDYSFLEHIQPFPEGYEAYEVLNASDCLITDYSSVMFDYAISEKKIILFDYDREAYQAKRGMYLDYNELPFPKVQTTEEFVKELDIPKNYDDREFLKTFCPYDNIDATKHLCEHVFLGKNVCKEWAPSRKKPNILIHGGSLVQNGITTAFNNLASALMSKGDANYYLSFSTGSTNTCPELLNSLPEKANYLPLHVNTQLTEHEAKLMQRFSYARNNTPLPEELKKAFAREWKRQFSDIVFDAVINFDSYTNELIVFFGQAPVKRKLFFIHNDMEKEIAEKDAVTRNPLHYACNTYDGIAVVSEALIPCMESIGERSDNLFVVHNLQSNETIKTKAKDAYRGDLATSVVSGESRGIQEILADPSALLFVTIGRFSPEKRHDRLLDAFNRFYADHPNAHLVIIGGYGVEYEATVATAQSLPCFNNVTIIRSLSNPFPILARSDLFILSSSHEGLPVTIAEADVLGVPVISTDLDSLRPFMQKHNGYLVPENTEGVYQGMLDFMAGKVKPMHINWEEYNAAALSEFYEALNGGGHGTK